MEIQYIGEHLQPGILGNIFVVLSFISALVAAVSYYFSTTTGDNGWRSIGRGAFLVHSLSVVAVIVTVFYLIINQYFEYDYVWKHSSKQMPLRYIFACFWEGQEGSYLLWMFWHVLIGSILIRRAREWESPVLGVFSLVQLFLASMMLGVYVMGQKIGSNPFTLIRNLPENIGLPWTMLPDYLAKIPQFSDGRGLNPLLQNYWMTIHPPTLFLGFALTLVPFAYAVAGLWKNDLTGWLKPVLPWSFAGVMVLGTGILMGGAWAYEALSFGGFWAWDPVENASLVPWLILVGAAHLVLINTKNQSSLFTAFFLCMGSFLLVLYSTFLTRSGVLGDTSVHSFTDNGMTGQLLLYLLSFLAMAVALLIRNSMERVLYCAFAATCIVLMIAVKEPVFCLIVLLAGSTLWLIRAYQKYFPKPEKEENLWSREFWIFVGSLVLMLAAGQVSLSTSIPVFNLLLKPFSGTFTSLYNTTGWQWLSDLASARIAPPSDAITHYNKWQIPFAFLVALLIAVGQYFSYRNTDLRTFGRKIMVSFVISILVTTGLFFAFEFEWKKISLLLLLFSSVFAVVANAMYFIGVLKGKIRFAGSSVAHVGFGLILLGALISTGKSEKISANQTTFDITTLNSKDSKFDNNEDMLLFRGDTTALGDYFVSYAGKNLEGVNQFYRINYFGQAPNQYTKGDLVISKGMVFEAKDDHTPSKDFIADQGAHWEIIDQPSSAQLRKVKLWNPHKAGEPLFTLYPRIQLNPKFGNVPEPDTRHYLHKDIYTHIRWAEISDRQGDAEGYLEPQDHTIAEGDTMFSARTIIVFEDLVGVTDFVKYRLLESDIAAAAKLKIMTGDGAVYHAEPLFILRDSTLQVPDIAEVKDAGLKIAITNIDPANRKVTFQVAEHKDNSREFIVMQAIVFPGINILWIGCMLMAIGTFIAIWQKAWPRRTKTA
jgi:cytochrome c-type biogenesis protein CcmF